MLCCGAFALGADSITLTEVADDLTFIGTTKETTVETFALNRDWQLKVEATLNPVESTNQWGTGLLASGTDPLAVYYIDGFQIYITNSGKISLKVNHHAGQGSTCESGVIFDTTQPTDYSITLTYYADPQPEQQNFELLVASNNEQVYTWSGNISSFSDKAVVNSLSSSITADQIAAGWAVKSVSLNTLASVPEPATATLSLLALAGLAARRKRH